MAFGALFGLIALALLVAAIIALLFDSRTRLWAAGLLLIAVPLVAVSLGLVAGMRGPAPSMVQPQNTSFQPQPIHPSLEIASYFFALIVLVALVALFYFIFAAEKSWFRQHVGSAGGWSLVVVGVVLVALLLPPKSINIPATLNNARLTNYRTVAETSPPPRTEAPKTGRELADVAGSTPKTAGEKPDTSNRPDWVNQPPSKQGDSYFVSVASGVYADPGHARPNARRQDGGRRESLYRRYCVPPTGRE